MAKNDKNKDYYEQRDDMYMNMSADAPAEPVKDDEAAKKLGAEMGMSPEDMARGQAAGAQTDQILSESDVAEPGVATNVATESEAPDLAPLAAALKKDEAYAQKFLDAANSLPEYGDIDAASLADIVKTDFNAKKSIMLVMSETPEVAPAVPKEK